MIDRVRGGHIARGIYSKTLNTTTKMETRLAGDDYAIEQSETVSPVPGSKCSLLNR